MSTHCLLSRAGQRAPVCLLYTTFRSLNPHNRKCERKPYAPRLRTYTQLMLGLGLIQPHMAQKPMLRGRVGARVLRARSVSRDEAWASAGVQGAWVSRFGCEAD
jgi:hypothetical protein